jgi:hypothetical protein
MRMERSPDLFGFEEGRPTAQCTVGPVRGCEDRDEHDR